MRCEKVFALPSLERFRVLFRFIIALIYHIYISSLFQTFYRFFDKFYPAGFYGREIYGKFAIITFTRSVHGAICSTSFLSD
jgi:hypothetical protein